jgi:SAM-dependent methyltransferase
MGLLALSRHLSFHARGDAAFAWHGLTGDVAEMSRDVLALLLAFDPRAGEAEVKEAPPAGLTPEQVEEFVPILRSRRFLVAAAPTGQSADEYSPLLAGHPRVPRSAVFHRRGERVTIYGRGTPMELDGRTAALFLRCDGERTLGQVLGDAGPAALPPLLRLARADVAALKVLAKAVSHGGVALNPAAESTMPYPELADPRAYAAGDAAAGELGAGQLDGEPTLSHLFRDPHPALKGRTFATALADGLVRRGALQHVKGRAGRVLVAGGASDLGAGLRNALPGPAAVAVADTLRGDASLLGAPEESLDLLISNETAGGLGTGPEGNRIVNHGALRLVREAAAALAPGGTLCIAELGDPKADPVRSDQGEWSIRFADLQAEATRLGLRAQVLALGDLLSLDGAPQALTTTRASFPALRALFAAHGLQLTRRAWLRTEIEQMCAGKLDLSEVHGLQWAPLGERTMGLSPRQYQVLLAHKPERVLH